MDYEDTGEVEVAVSGGQVANGSQFLERYFPEGCLIAVREAYSQFSGALADPALDSSQRAMMTAAAAVELRTLLGGDVLEKVIMPLANTQFGFDTDRNPGKGYEGRPYSPEVVLDCTITALLTGLPMVGNLWNIIGGSMYVRKQGFEFLVRPIAQYGSKIEVPPIGPDLYRNGGYLIVPTSIRYQLLGPDGQTAADSEPQTFGRNYHCRLTRRNPVGVEFLSGKALRKGLRDLYHQLTGQLLNDADLDEAPRAGVHQVGTVHDDERVGSYLGDGGE